MLAGVGFEPHDLRVMSPTSYQAALSRDIKLNKGCRTPGSNRYDTFVSRDFKSRASANSATPAHIPKGHSLVCHIIIPLRGAFVNTFLEIIYCQSREIMRRDEIISRESGDHAIDSSMSESITRCPSIDGWIPSSERRLA